MAGFAVLATTSARSQDDDPAARWVTVYGWIQTAERLGAAGQSALALGSYLEAQRQITSLAASHPDFEPELIGYRLGKLEETIAAAEAGLSSDEHETMMKYLDFIESLEQGQAQRFANDLETAFSTLNMARALLDEIIEKKPETFRAAVDSQYQRLVESINWIDSQINFKEISRTRAPVEDGIDWGTTRFVKADDLPDSDDGTVPTGILFPGALGVMADSGTGPVEGAPPSEEESGREETEGGTAVPRVRFRMSSREKSSPAPHPAEPGGVSVRAPLP